MSEEYTVLRLMETGQPGRCGDSPDKMGQCKSRKTPTAIRNRSHNLKRMKGENDTCRIALE